jgi:RimJ/RimL family protein N-acetyltransferase
LEPLARGHAGPLLASARESRETFDFTEVPGNADGLAAYIDAAVADQRAGSALPFAIVDRRDERVVGTTRFLDLDYWTDPPSGPAGTLTVRPDGVPTTAEVGSTWLAASAQRTAVNTEAKLLMFTHAFETWGVLRVTLKTDARNVRSRRAIERVGGRFEGIRRAHRLAEDGTVRDSAYYSILVEEWPEVRAGLRARLAEPRSARVGSGHYGGS